jgi:hypothetical protein
VRAAPLQASPQRGSIAPCRRARLRYGTTCPTGWKERTDLKGQLLAVAPGAGGTTNKQPPLGVNETGRVGPHGHAATATITDPGHAHANTLADPGHTHAATVTDPGHEHGVVDPGHKHVTPMQGRFGAPAGGGGVVDSGNTDQKTDTTASATGVTVNINPTGVTVDNAAASGGVTISNVAAPAGVTADVAVAPTGGAYYPLAYVIACVRDNWCPPDKPVGVAATPVCMVKDPIGSGYHCALSCKADADCGAHGTCSTAFGPANGVCVYAPA